MKRDDFIKNINLYGADIEEWPADMKGDARAACAGSAELRTLIDEERAFETSLKALTLEEPSRDLAERIIMSAPDRPHFERRGEGEDDRGPSLAQLLWMFLSPKPAVALAFTLVVGIIVGYTSPVVNNMSEEENVVVAFLYHDEALP